MKKVIMTLIILFFFSSLVYAETDEVKRLILKGKWNRWDYGQEVDFDELLYYLNKALEIDPNSSIAHYERGQINWMLGKIEIDYRRYDKSIPFFKKALNDLNDAIAYDPGNVNWYTSMSSNWYRHKCYICRGDTYFCLGNMKRFCQDYEKACNIMYISESCSDYAFGSYCKKIGNIEDDYLSAERIHFIFSNMKNEADYTYDAGVMNFERGSFTKKGANEAIVIFYDKNQPNATGYIEVWIMIYDEAWIPFKKIGDSNDTKYKLIDVNNDSISEIYIWEQNLGHGCCGIWDSVLSLKGGKLNKIYSEKGFDYGASSSPLWCFNDENKDDYTYPLKKELIELNKIHFEDRDKDGLTEMIVNKTKEFYVFSDERSWEYDSKETETIIYDFLDNGDSILATKLQDVPTIIGVPEVKTISSLNPSKLVSPDNQGDWKQFFLESINFVNSGIKYNIGGVYIDVLFKTSISNSDNVKTVVAITSDGKKHTMKRDPINRNDYTVNIIYRDHIVVAKNILSVIVPILLPLNFGTIITDFPFEKDHNTLCIEKVLVTDKSDKEQTFKVNRPIPTVFEPPYVGNF